MEVQEKIRDQFYKWLELKSFIEKEKTLIEKEEKKLSSFIPENDNDLVYIQKEQNNLSTRINKRAKKTNEYDNLELVLLSNFTNSLKRIIIVNLGKLTHIEIFKKDGKLGFIDTDGK